MNIDLCNPAHLLLLSLAFFLWGGLNNYVSEKQEKVEDTWLEFPTVILLIINAAIILGSVIKLTIDAL